MVVSSGCCSGAAGAFAVCEAADGMTAVRLCAGSQKHRGGAELAGTVGRHLLLCRESRVALKVATVLGPTPFQSGHHASHLAMNSSARLGRAQVVKRVGRNATRKWSCN